jgi:hypothetical protein
MVIGTGMIAKIFNEFNNSDDVIIFASGVSDSTCEDKLQFKREFDLIDKINKSNPNKLFIYFSSINLTENTAYYKHKKKMESTIKKFEKYIILRVPQIVGNGGNKQNFFNFIKNKIVEGSEINLKNGLKSLIDVDDLKIIVHYVVKNNLINVIINFSYIELMETKKIISIIGDELNITPKIKDDNKFNSVFFENCSISKEIIYYYKLDEENYIKKLIKKYV